MKRITVAVAVVFACLVAVYLTWHVPMRRAGRPEPLPSGQLGSGLPWSLDVRAKGRSEWWTKVMLAAEPGTSKGALLRRLGKPDVVLAGPDLNRWRLQNMPAGTMQALEYVAGPETSTDNIAYIYLSGLGTVLSCEFETACINYVLP